MLGASVKENSASQHVEKCTLGCLHKIVTQIVLTCAHNLCANSDPPVPNVAICRSRPHSVPAACACSRCSQMIWNFALHRNWSTQKLSVCPEASSPKRHGEEFRLSLGMPLKPDPVVRASVRSSAGTSSLRTASGTSQGPSGRGDLRTSSCRRVHLSASVL